MFLCEVCHFSLTLSVPTPQNGETHSNNLSVFDNFVGLVLKAFNFNSHCLAILVSSAG